MEVKKNFKDKFLQMQKRQLEAFTESDRQNREFLMIRKSNSRTRLRRQREQGRKFFMQLAKLLAKK